MQNLKTHNILRNHIEHIKEIYTENELLKHIIENLKDENAKLTKNIAVKHNNMMRIQNEKQRENQSEKQLEKQRENQLEKQRENNLLVKRLFGKNNTNNASSKELLVKRLFGKNNANNANTYHRKIKEYNPSENLEINKLRVPKLLFILYK